jgi:SAM-dependent methyltransferase
VLLISATLKMVQRPRRALEECRRVLVPGGHLILLDVTPWGIRVGLRRGHFEADRIANIWSLSRTQKEISSAGFHVLRSHRFMLLPVAAPGARAAEAVVRGVGLGGLLLQQSLLARAV